MAISQSAVVPSAAIVIESHAEKAVNSDRVVNCDQDPRAHQWRVLRFTIFSRYIPS